MTYSWPTLTLQPSGDLGWQYFEFRFEDSNSAGSVSTLEVAFDFRVMVVEPNYRPEVQSDSCDGIKLGRNELLGCVVEVADENLSDTLTYTLE